MDGARAKHLVDALQSDLHAICAEAKRKNDRLKQVSGVCVWLCSAADPLPLFFSTRKKTKKLTAAHPSPPPGSQSAEHALVWLREVTAHPPPGGVLAAVRHAGTDDGPLPPVLLALDDGLKHPRLAQLGLGCLVRLADGNALAAPTLTLVVEALARLVAASVEDLRVLQVLLALVSHAAPLQRALLAATLSLFCRVHAKKDPAAAAVAAATLQQAVVFVMERVDAEDATGDGGGGGAATAADAAGAVPRHPRVPPTLRPRAADAFLLFQDLCALAGGEAPQWLPGAPEVPRPLALDLLAAALGAAPDVFVRHPEFSHLLKEHVCALVIRLFSPSVKVRC
jgi:hypothetical protein